MTRGIGFKDNNSHTGRMSDAPAIRCCKLLDGDGFILITTPSINDVMPAQKAINIGSKALQAAGHVQASETAEQKESCFEAAGRIITKAMAIAPEEASAMAAHVMLVRSKDAEVSAPPEPKRQCILKDLYPKCQSCKDRVGFNPRPFSESNRCKFCAVEMDHLDRQCLNTPHEPGQSPSAQTPPKTAHLGWGTKNFVSLSQSI